ncbi:MAG: ParB/RepB/Spo0J family partition protein [Mollicutes bacterium]|nr:ParB/RepB/Spo0J family partition protein [Mollicutes bacterium]
MNNIIKLKIREIDSFKDHPFKVVNDDSLMQLAQSIKDNGLLVPIVVRKKEDNRYEIISGHRRKAAVELNGEEYIDAIIKDLTYDEAVIEMVDSNMYRDKILPSEKAFAYKMKLDAMKHQGKKISPKGTKSQSINEIDDTKTQIYRYVRLTNLIPELLKLVDDTVLKDKRTVLTMGLKPAVELSYLNKEEQKLVYMGITYEDVTPSHGQAIKIRELSKNKKLTFDSLEEILCQQKGNQK